MKSFSTDKSSNIKSVGYEGDTKTLMVEFKNGSKYVYEDVPVELFEAFGKADSAGKFFFANVRGKYKFSRMQG
jgi:hypothetical protein